MKNKQFPFRVRDEMDYGIYVKDAETAAWYARSWPNKNGMTLNGPTLDESGLAEVTEICRDGVVVGKR